MVEDPDACYRALASHDPRFDGRFFVGVSSTKIYCRPVCSVRVPMRKNCRFFRSAAEAEAAGYRPCLRCRPELAPGNAGIDASRRLARRAASAIEDGALEERSLGDLAEQLGVGDRHLRRVFAAEFGVTPIAFAQTQRLLLAKRLLTDTALPITEVAFASGFSSVRRFNALFKERYRLGPQRLRARTPRGASADATTFELSYRPPYAWPELLAFLGARAIAGVENGEGGAYRRALRVTRGGRERIGWIAAQPHPRKNTMCVRVSSSLLDALPPVLAKVKHALDLDADPVEIGAALGQVAAAHPGLRVPGAFDGFEIAVRAVLGQQISVKAARTLAGRFAATFGTPLETPFENVTCVFPSAEDVAPLRPQRVEKLGIVPARARTILALARAIADGSLSLAPGADVEDAIAKLQALPGIGAWTAHYVAMRALAWPDAFPHADLGLMKALQVRAPKLVLAAGERWRPWRAYAAMHLWNTLS